MAPGVSRRDIRGCRRRRGYNVFGCFRQAVPKAPISACWLSHTTRDIFCSFGWASYTCVPCKWQSMTAVTAATAFQTKLAIERGVRSFMFGVGADDVGTETGL